MAKDKQEKQIDQSESKDSKSQATKRVSTNKACAQLARYKQDPFWYAEDAAAIKNMASFPWNDVFGSCYNGLIDDPEAKLGVVPHLIVARYYPIVGNTKHFNDGNYVNKAADAYFQYLTQGFTSSVSFQASDLLCSAIAAASLLGRLMAGARIYGLLDYFEQLNKALPKDLILGLGYDYDDWTDNKANFRTEYNLRVKIFNKNIALPHGFTIGDRWQFLNSMLFTDTKSPEYSTYYCWEPECDLIYNATAAKTGTCLQWETIKGTGSGGLIKVDDFFNHVDKLLDALDDDDVRGMFGALRRVYSPDQFKKMNNIDLEYATPVILHDVVAMQFHNMNWVTRYIYANENNSAFTDVEDMLKTPVYQDERGKLVTSVNYVYPVNDEVLYEVPLTSDRRIMIDMYDHMISPENVLDATALAGVPMLDAATTGRVGNDEVIFVPWSGRCEIINRVNVVSINPNTEATRFEVLLKLCAMANATENKESFELPVGAVKALSVDSHPLLGGYGRATIEAREVKFTPIVTYIGEIDHYTMVSDLDLIKLHSRSLYKLLSLPVNKKSTSK